jgi:hypothetical protein
MQQGTLQYVAVIISSKSEAIKWRTVLYNSCQWRQSVSAAACMNSKLRYAQRYVTSLLKDRFVIFHNCLFLR